MSFALKKNLLVVVTLKPSFSIFFQMSRRTSTGRVSDIFASPAVAPRAAAFASPGAPLAVSREDVKIISEDRKQINLILGELRKELARMDQDDWRYPVGMVVD